MGILFPTFVDNGGSKELWLCKIVEGRVTPVCGPEPLPAGWATAVIQERLIETEEGKLEH